MKKYKTKIPLSISIVFIYKGYNIHFGKMYIKSGISSFHNAGGRSLNKYLSNFNSLPPPLKLMIIKFPTVNYFTQIYENCLLTIIVNWNLLFAGYFPLPKSCFHFLQCQKSKQGSLIGYRGFVFRCPKGFRLYVPNIGCISIKITNQVLFSN